MLAATPDVAGAGAFTLEKSETKVFATAYVTSGDHYFDGRGRLKARDRLKKQDLQLYIEHGLADGLTVFGAGALERITVSGDERSQRSGLGRTELGVRVRLAEPGAWIVSAQGGVVIAGAKRSEGPAAVGETDDQVDLRLLVARSFDAFARPAFLDVQAGYRTRSGDPADEVRVDATLGVRPAARWLLLAQSFNVFGQGRWGGPYALKQRTHKVQAAALLDLTSTMTIYAAVFATPAARDALDERGAQLGIGYRF
ncbi:hypothetical protein [Methylopila sp. 73B]|uniref:hypothetical protein n=1 Tax=Methylopila sp. 73B TaxID=1120792 RepID=UPI000370102F|nr:hypothetical protein [Methylopila sp. 73B]